MSRRKKIVLLAAALLILFVLLLVFFPSTRSELLAAPLLIAGALYNLFALLIVGSFVALLGWYVFGVLLPGLYRYRKLKQIRYYREVQRRRRGDYDDDL